MRRLPGLTQKVSCTGEREARSSDSWLVFLQAHHEVSEIYQCPHSHWAPILCQLLSWVPGNEGGWGWGRGSAVRECRNIIAYTFITLYSLQSTKLKWAHLNFGPQTNLRSMYPQYISEKTTHCSRGPRQWQSQDTTLTTDLKTFSAAREIKHTHVKQLIYIYINKYIFINLIHPCILAL